MILQKNDPALATGFYKYKFCEDKTLIYSTLKTLLK